MKKQFFKTSLFLLILIFGLITTSCSDEDDNVGAGGSAALGTVKANVDGYNFVSDPAETSLAIVPNSIGAQMFITANDLEGRELRINITAGGYFGEGEYEIGGENFHFVTAFWTVGDVNDPSNSDGWMAPYNPLDDTIVGFLNIESDSGDNLQGTFEFTADRGLGDPIDITNGSFNLDY